MGAADLAALLHERQPCVVLTGAGISTESGIPDFRSPSGIWAEVDPFEVASIQAFRRDPERVWGFYRTRIGMLLDAEPNAGHLALAELERRGLVQAVVTQNIDTLHSRAGSCDVVEVHGSIRAAECLRCHWRQDTEGVLAQLEEHPAPLCLHCGEILKPGVTLFGELLPPGAMERATDLARRASLVLVVGSSLEVWPVAGLPLEARAYAIVNRGATALDDGAVLRIDAPAGETLAAVIDELLGVRLQPDPQTSWYDCAVASSTPRRRRAGSEKDLVSRLTEAGEDALQRISELPGGQRAVGAFNDLRNRVDELSKKVRGIEQLEERVAKLEQEVASLKRSKSTTRKSSTSRSRATPSSSE